MGERGADTAGETSERASSGDAHGEQPPQVPFDALADQGYGDPLAAALVVVDAGPCRLSGGQRGDLASAQDQARCGIPVQEWTRVRHPGRGATERPERPAP